MCAGWSGEVAAGSRVAARARKVLAQPVAAAIRGGRRATLFHGTIIRLCGTYEASPLATSCPDCLRPVRRPAGSLGGAVKPLLTRRA